MSRTRCATPAQAGHPSLRPGGVPILLGVPMAKPMPRITHKSPNPYRHIVRLMADCHPTRRLFREGLCRACFQLRGQLGLGQLRWGLPLRIPNVEQRAVTSIPEHCPECDGLVYCEVLTADDPALARRVACAICGWDAYLTSDVIVAIGRTEPGGTALPELPARGSLIPPGGCNSPRLQSTRPAAVSSLL